MSFLSLLGSLHAAAALAGVCIAHSVHVHERNACEVDGSGSFTLHVLHACMAFTSESILTKSVLKLEYDGSFDGSFLELQTCRGALALAVTLALLIIGCVVGELGELEPRIDCCLGA